MEEKLNDQMLIRRGKLEKITALGFEPYGGYPCGCGSFGSKRGACQSGRPYYDYPRARKNGILHAS